MYIKHYEKEPIMHIILASASPRRKELIHQIGWTADIEKSSFPEVSTIEEAEKRRNTPLLADFQGPDLVCAENALGKAENIQKRTGSPLPILGADTIVTLDGKILGKPKDEKDAFSMLRFLSGKTHKVKTAAALLQGKKKLLRVVTTSVHFRDLTDQEISAYIATGEPMDKAGAYGIQGQGTLLVTGITGSYDNVVGLPLTTVYEMMKEIRKG